MNFYLRELPKCYCGKVATHAVHSSGSSTYGSFCHAHAQKKMRELQQQYAQLRTSAEQER